MVAGKTILISAATEIKGAFVVGHLVKVHALLAEDGSLTAREIELAARIGEWLSRIQQ